MTFTAPLGAFYSFLQFLLQAVPSRSQIAVLENIRFVVAEGILTATASDQEITIISEMPVSVQEPGEILVPGRKFVDLIKALGQNGECTVSADSGTGKVTVSTPKGQYSMFGLSTGEFPSIPSVEQQNGIVLPLVSIQEVAQRTPFAVSKDEYRPAMTGVYLVYNSGLMTSVATDGFRLIRYRAPIETAIDDTSAFDVIVPVRAVELFKKATSDVRLSVSHTHARFEMHDTVVITRLIEEKYPAYEAVIPKNNDKSLVVETSQFLTAVRRVSLFANTSTRQVKLRFGMGGDCSVVAEDPDTGAKAQESLYCEHDCGEFEIGFNHKYIEDALSNIGSHSRVKMSFSQSHKAALLVALEGDTDVELPSVLMLVMPVRL